MRSNAVPDRDGVLAVVERFRAAVTELVELRLDALGVPDLFAALDAIEAGPCQLPVIEHGATSAHRAVPPLAATRLRTCRLTSYQ